MKHTCIYFIHRGMFFYASKRQTEIGEIMGGEKACFIEIIKVRDGQGKVQEQQ